MKYLSLYEQWAHMNSTNPNSPFLKNYGESFPLSQLKKGDKVTYYGTQMYVFPSHDICITLHKDPNGDPADGTKVNQNMFKEKGAILRNYTE